VSARLGDQDQLLHALCGGLARLRIVRNATSCHGERYRYFACEICAFANISALSLHRKDSAEMDCFFVQATIFRGSEQATDATP
jgi:hypothetical protein